MNKRHLAVALLMMSLFAETANAIVCTGNVQQIRTWQNGGEWLGVDIGYGMWLLCKPSVQTGGVSPEMCRSIQALMTTAFSLGKKINIDFGTNYTDCTTVPDWSALAIGMTYITP